MDDLFEVVDIHKQWLHLQSDVQFCRASYPSFILSLTQDLGGLFFELNFVKLLATLGFILLLLSWHLEIEFQLSASVSVSSMLVTVQLHVLHNYVRHLVEFSHWRVSHNICRISVRNLPATHHCRQRLFCSVVVLLARLFLLHVKLYRGAPHKPFAEWAKFAYRGLFPVCR